MQIFYPKFGNIFNFCRIFAVPVTELAHFCLGSWQKSIWEDGGVLFGNLATNIHISFKYMNYMIQ